MSSTQRFLRTEIGTMVKGPCTFPHFNFSYFYLYKEGNFGSIGNVSRDGVLFVA